MAERRAKAQSGEDILRSRGASIPLVSPYDQQVKVNKSKLDSIDTNTLRSKMLGFEQPPAAAQKPKMFSLEWLKQQDKKESPGATKLPDPPKSLFPGFKENTELKPYEPSIIDRAKGVGDKIKTFLYGMGSAAGGDTAGRAFDGLIENSLEKEAQRTGNTKPLQHFIDDRNYWDKDKLYNSFMNRKPGSEITKSDQFIKGAGGVAGDILEIMATGEIAAGLGAAPGILGKILPRAATGAMSGAENAYGGGADAKGVIKEALKSAGFFVVGGAAADKAGAKLVEKLTPVYHKYPEFGKALQTLVAAGRGAAMGTTGAATSAGLGALFGDEVDPKEILRTGLYLAGAEVLTSILMQQPFKPTFDLQGKSGIKKGVEDTAEYFRKNGYKEFREGSGIWLKHDPKTGVLLEQKSEIITLRGVNVYKNDIWKVEREIGRALTPDEIVKAATTPDYWKTLRGEARAGGAAAPVQEQPINSGPINQEEITNQIMQLTGGPAPNISPAAAAVAPTLMSGPNVPIPSQNVTEIAKNLPKTPENVTKIDTPNRKVMTGRYGEVEILEDKGATVRIKNSLGTELEVGKKPFEKDIVNTGTSRTPSNDPKEAERGNGILEERKAQEAKKAPAKTTDKELTNTIVEVNGKRYQIRGSEGDNFVTVNQETGKKEFLPKTMVEEYKKVDEIKKPMTMFERENGSGKAISDRSVKAYQYENPEIKPYFKQRAKELLHDIQSTVKGERIPIKDDQNNIIDYTGTKKLTSESIQIIQDETGASYPDIADALRRIIEDHGQENIALAKKIERVIDDNLVNGYKTFEGDKIEPHRGYVTVRNKIEKHKIELPEKEIKKAEPGLDNQLTLGLPGDQSSLFDIKPEAPAAAPKKEEPKTYTIYRRDKSDMSLDVVKPQGLYVSMVKDRNNFKSPHMDEGDTDYWGELTPKKPLIVETSKINHARNNGGFVETSAGVSALKALTTPEEFNKLIELTKKELISLLNDKFPGHDYNRFYDSYELLEAYAANLAKQKGYDAIVQDDKGLPEFSEIAILDNSLVKFERPAAAAPKEEVKKVDPPAAAPQTDIEKIKAAGAASIKMGFEIEADPKKINKKTWYHGTGTTGLDPGSLDVIMTKIEGLFGQGIYLTDNKDIAKGYADSRGKKTQSSVIYEANTKIDKVINLEEYLPEDAFKVIEKIAGQISKNFDEPNLLEDIKDIHELGGTGEKVMRSLSKWVEEISQGQEIPVSEFVEYFTDINVLLKEAGYDAYTHTGGKRTGKDPHQVLILLDPNDMLSKTGRKGQVTKFETVEKKTPDQKIQEAAAPKNEYPTEPVARAEKFEQLFYKGEPMGLQEVKDHVKHLLENEDQIKADLSKLKNAELQQKIQSIMRSNYTKKEDMVNKIYSDYLTETYLNIADTRMISHDFGTDYKTMVIKKINATLSDLTQDKLDKILEKKKADRAAALEKKKAMIDGVKDPKTLEDFERAKRIRKLKPEEQDQYEDILATSNKEKRSAAAERDRDRTLKTAAAVISKTADNLSITKTKDTRDQSDLWVVKLPEKLPKEEYIALKQQMMKLKGNWSSFTKGFNFKYDPTEALKGEALENVPVKAEPEKKGFEKIREVADNMQSEIDDLLGGNRLANTARRANMAASAEASGRSMERMQQTMRNIADALEKGEVKLLDKITARTEIKALDDILRISKYSRAQAEQAIEVAKYDDRWTGSQKGSDVYKQIMDSPLSVEDIRYATYPAEEIYKESLQRIVTAGQNTPGLKLIANRLEKLIQQSKEDKVDLGRHVEDFKELVKGLPDKDKVNWMDDLVLNRNRLERLGINSEEELRAYLREYLPLRSGEKAKTKADLVKEKQRELIGRKIDGYVPTPKKLVEQMLDYADIGEGMTILEPSAGQGHIADELGVGKVDVAEWDGANREILQLKGHNVIGNDALQIVKKYDRIVMNPPFERNQDIQHVRHAYNKNLKPGGKLVAIMSEHPFFANDKESKAFRDWLDRQDHEVIDIEAGAFLESDRSTGVKTRMVVIDKPEAAPEAGGEEGFSSKGGGPKMGEATGSTQKNYKNVKSASAIVKEFERRLGLTVKKGGIHYTKLGTFNNRTHLTRIAKANDLGVLSHEAGHYLDRLFNLSQTQVTLADPRNSLPENKELLLLGANTSRASTPLFRQRREGVAEYIRLRLTEGQAVINRAPAFTREFDRLVPKEFTKVLEEIRQHITELTNLDPVSRIKTSIRFKKGFIEKAGEVIQDPKGAIQEKLEDVNISEALRKIYTGIVDASYPIEWAAGELGGKVFQDRIKNELSTMRGYEGIALFDINPKGQKKYFQTDLEGKRVGKSYFDITRSFHKSEEVRRDFWAYSVARRNADYIAKGLEMPDTKQTYEAAIVKLESQYPEFKKTFDDVLEYRNNSLNLLVEAGVYSPEAVQKIRDANPNYVSLKRIKEAIETVSGSGSKLGGAKKVIKKRTGGGEDIIDPEEFDIANTFINRSVAMRNKMLQELLRMSEQSEGKGWLMSRAPSKTKITEFNLEEVKKYLREALQNSMPDLMDEYGDAKQFVDTLDLDIMARVFDPNYLAGPNQIVVYENGDPILVDVHPELYESIVGINVEDANAITKAMMIAAQIQKTGIILTPRFIAYNMGRDTFHNLVSTDSGINPVDIFGGLISTMTKDKWFRLAARKGGTTNYFTANDRVFAQEAIDDILHNQTRADKIISGLKHPLRALQDAIEPGEMAGRTAEIRKAVTNYLKAAGMSSEDIAAIDDQFLSNLSSQMVDEAIGRGRNLSVDFRKMGAWIKKLNLNRIVNFLNPNIQGTVNVGKLFKDHPIRTMFKGFAYMTIPTLFLYWLNYDNENYRELPHWRRDFFWNIPLGDTKTTRFFLPIPRPWELGVIFAAIPERLLTAHFRQNPGAWDGFKETVAEMLVPSMMPSAIEPLYRDATNTRWTGSPLLNMGDKLVSPDLQYNDYTNKMLVNIAADLRGVPGLPDFMYSPKRFQQVIEGYTGTLGKMGLGAIDSLMRGENPMEGGIGRTFTVDTYRQPQSVDDFYTYREDLNTKAADLRRLNPDLEVEQLDPILSVHLKAFNAADKALEVLRGASKLLEDSKNPDRALEQAAIQADIIDITRAVNKIYEENYR